MAKHTGITIRIGAAYDQVEINNKHGNVATFDRSVMRKDGKANLQGTLRREVVDTWAKMQEQRTGSKDRRAGRINGKVRDKQRRENA